MRKAYFQSIQAHSVLKESLENVKHVYETLEQQNHLLKQLITQKNKIISNQTHLIKNLKANTQKLDQKITELQDEIKCKKDELIVKDNYQQPLINCETTESIKLDLEREKKSNLEKDLIIANLMKSKSAIKIHFEEKLKLIHNQFMEDIKKASAQSKSQMEKVYLENRKLKTLIENASKSNDFILTCDNSLLSHGLDVNKSAHKAVTIINDLTISSKSKKMKLEKQQKVSQVLTSLNDNWLSNPFGCDKKQKQI